VTEPSPPGFYHVAIRYPTRAALGEALDLRDPDRNGVELYWDRPREAWPRDADGSLAMVARPLDPSALLGERGP
jgi:catechol 2,3-dioxygenase